MTSPISLFILKLSFRLFSILGFICHFAIQSRFISVWMEALTLRNATSLRAMLEW